MSNTKNEVYSVLSYFTIGESIYNTALDMKLVWNDQANHASSNMYVFLFGCNLHLMYPDSAFISGLVCCYLCQLDCLPTSKFSIAFCKNQLINQFLSTPPCWQVDMITFINHVCKWNQLPLHQIFCCNFSLFFKYLHVLLVIGITCGSNPQELYLIKPYNCKKTPTFCQLPA